MLSFVGRTRELALLERHLAGEGPPVLLLAGEPEPARERLEAALAIFGRLGARKDAEQVEQEIATL